MSTTPTGTSSGTPPPKEKCLQDFLDEAEETMRRIKERFGRPHPREPPPAEYHAPLPAHELPWRPRPQEVTAQHGKEAAAMLLRFRDEPAGAGPALGKATVSPPRNDSFADVADLLI